MRVLTSLWRNDSGCNCLASIWETRTHPAQRQDGTHPLNAYVTQNSASSSRLKCISRPSSAPAAQQQKRKPLAKRPKLDNALVIVEGKNDRRAVLAAVDAEVFVLGTATAPLEQNSSVVEELQSRLSAQPGIAVVILTDPDTAGRQARNSLDRQLGGCWHAFIPQLHATLKEDKTFKTAGDVGVEHASPSTIYFALKASRRSRLNRTVFERAYLEEMGLASSFDGSKDPHNSARRRYLVCSYLGLGLCNGKQLLKQLNNYGFTMGDVEKALQWANEQITNVS